MSDFEILYLVLFFLSIIVAILVTYINHRTIESDLSDSCVFGGRFSTITYSPKCASQVERFLLDEEFRRNFLSSKKVTAHP